jgi:cytochrome P450
MGISADQDLASAWSELPYLDDPMPLYERLRNEAPVFRTPDGFWYVTPYELVSEVLRHPRLYASDRSNSAEPDPYRVDPADGLYARIMSKVILSQDGVAHRRLRNLVGPAFTRGAIEDFRTQVRQGIVAQLDEMLEASSGRGERACDLKADFTLPIPTRIILEMFGFPRAEASRFYEMADTIVAPIDRATPEEWHRQASAVFERHWEFVIDAARERKENPGDDLLSRVVTSDDAEGGVTDLELLAFVAFLITAGFETTANTFASGMYRLMQDPEQLTAVREDPSRTRGAVEEMLRFEPATRNSTPRFVLEDIELGGQVLRKGETVFVSIHSANHDPDVFDNPEQFDIDRHPNSHLSFAAGPHACLGMALARMELEEGINALLRSLPDLELAGTPEWHPSLVIRGLRNLPVKW